MQFLMMFVAKCWVLVLPLLVILVATPLLYLYGYRDLAWFISSVGTVVTMLVVFLYVLFIDSHERWPHLSLLQRAERIMFPRKQ